MRTIDSPRHENDTKFYQTADGDFSTIEKKFETSKHNPEDKMNETIDSFMLTNEGDIAKLNSKSLYQMNPDELKLSIMWKKRFL